MLCLLARQNLDFVRIVQNKQVTDVMPFAVPVSRRREPPARTVPQKPRKPTGPPAEAGEEVEVEALVDEEVAAVAAEPGETPDFPSGATIR